LGFRRSPRSARARVGPLTRWRALRDGATHDDDDDGVMGKDGTMGDKGATGDGATTTTWQRGRNVDDDGDGSRLDKDLGFRRVPRHRVDWMVTASTS
jgi:hypothetical protein